MNLSDIKLIDEPVAMPILDLDDEPIKDKDGNVATIFLYGADSKQYRKVDAELTQKRLKKAAKKGNLAAMFEDTDTTEKDRLKRLAALIFNWSSIYESESEPELEYSPENALRLVTDYPVIADQIEKFATERVNFTKK